MSGKTKPIPDPDSLREGLFVDKTNEELIMIALHYILLALAPHPILSDPLAKELFFRAERINPH